MSLDGRVLLLNQTYEPLGTVGVARAMIMLFKNSVTVEEWDGDRVLRTPRDAYPVPSVLRRRTYVNVRRRREVTGSKRVRIYIRDGFRCQYCGERKNPVELTLDHILPRSRGGGGSAINIVTACLACNQRKGNRTPEEARMPLLTAQSALGTQLERVVLCHYAEARPEWRKYIFTADEETAAHALRLRRA
jgi:5-methylcytosine-specific restriction endonuclease McrA